MVCIGKIPLSAKGITNEITYNHPIDICSVSCSIIHRYANLDGFFFFICVFYFVYLIKMRLSMIWWPISIPLTLSFKPRLCPCEKIRRTNTEYKLNFPSIFQMIAVSGFENSSFYHQETNIRRFKSDKLRHITILWNFSK